jgi:transposase-like protein
MEPINAALEALESLKPGETPQYAKVAREFGVDRSTLSRRHQGVCASQTEGYNQQQLLTAQQEVELIKYIDSVCKRSTPPLREMIRNFASKIA